MDDFNLYDLIMNAPEKDVVTDAHSLMDSEREPYVEDYDYRPSLVGVVFTSPFRVSNDSYTVY